ncbi:MAG: LytTR family DNA-binding domain-containing protein [Terrimicrobiaceae bacterium]
MLRLMLVDDEPLARQGLKELLAELDNVSVVAEAASVAEALVNIARHKPEALILDIRMPEATGFDLLKNLTSPLPVVFVTAYTEYAVRAFDVQAVDYLLKPVRPARLAEAIQRLQSVINSPDHDETPYAMADRICLRTPERTIVAPLGDVIVLQAEKDFTRVSVAGNPPLLICQSLGTYERNLPKPPFLRIDRSTILNTSRLLSVEISPTRGAHVTLDGLSSPLALGRSGLRRLRQAIPQGLALAQLRD